MRKGFAVFLISAGLVVFASSGLKNIPVASAATESFRFITWADTKIGTNILTDESKSVSSLNPAFTVYPGDLIDCGRATNPACFSNGFPAWKMALNGGGTNSLFDKTFVTRGNHDANTDIPWRADFDFAAVAKRIGATNYSEQTLNTTYSFDYGNSHFVGLDLPGGDVSTISSLEITWLDGDLAAAENRGLTHAFLFWHGPIYPVGIHPSTAPSALITALNKHGIVSAAFFGHEHTITYTHIDNTRIPAVTHPFEEFITGAAGAALHSPTAGLYDYWLNDGSGSSKNGFLAIDVSGDKFTTSVFNVDGSLAKSFSFTKR